MRSFSHTLDGVEVAFDDRHLVADAGLILAATLAEHLGLRELFDDHVDLGAVAGRANVGHKAWTVIHSVLAGGDSPVSVVLDGGELEVEVGEDLHVTLSGWAVPVYAGRLTDDFIEELHATE